VADFEDLDELLRRHWRGSPNYSPHLRFRSFLSAKCFPGKKIVAAAFVARDSLESYR